MTAPAAVRPDPQFATAHAADRASTHPYDFLGVAPELFAARDTAGTLDSVLSLARRTFRCDAAGVMLIAPRGSAVATAASTTEARRADALQLEHHQGPGFDAISARQPVVSAELRFDSRWRFWAPQAADVGFRSVLSLVLTAGEPFGAVTLYSWRPSFFRADSFGTGTRFAQQASIAIAVAVERDQLVRARDSRGVIGQAQGIMMERYTIDADQAFAVLKRYSSHLNTKLRLVAERVVRNRSLPELDQIGFLAARDATSARGGIGTGVDCRRGDQTSCHDLRLPRPASGRGR
jgi:ANTAR domain/GAF domain